MNTIDFTLIFRETDHLNVIKVLGQCVETVPYLVVLELCPFVSELHFILDKGH